MVLVTNINKPTPTPQHSFSDTRKGYHFDKILLKCTMYDILHINPYCLVSPDCLLFLNVQFLHELDCNLHELTMNITQELSIIMWIIH